MADVVLIARCPAHGLHGQREECFVCGGPVEQVPMVPADADRRYGEHLREVVDHVRSLPDSEQRAERLREFPLDEREGSAEDRFDCPGCQMCGGDPCDCFDPQVGS